MPDSLPADVAENNGYSYGVLDGETLHVSGMVAFGSDGSYVGIGDVHAQAVQVFENLAAVLEADDEAVAVTAKVSACADSPRR